MTSGLNTAETANLIKIILKRFIKRQQYKESIKQAFLSKYSIIPIHQSKRVSRHQVYVDIEETLRLPPDNVKRNYIKSCLQEIGVVPTHSKGYNYFRGIIKNAT